MRVVSSIIIGLNFKADSVEAIIVPNPEIKVLRVGILYIRPYSLRVSQVDLFIHLFRLQSEASLVLEISV